MTYSKDLIEALMVTAELTGTEFSKAAATVLANDLSLYPEPMVIGALAKVRREVRGRFTLADVLSRLDDGRPGPEEAWAIVPKSELDTAVWTEEMAEAFGVANPLLQMGDRVAARVAFVEAYRRLVQQARDERRPVKWTPTLGHDPRGRAGALMDAARKGRVSIAVAETYALPEYAEGVKAMLSNLKITPESRGLQITGPVEVAPMPEEVRKRIRKT